MTWLVRLRIVVPDGAEQLHLVLGGLGVVRCAFDNLKRGIYARIVCVVHQPHGRKVAPTKLLRDLHAPGHRKTATRIGDPHREEEQEEQGVRCRILTQN